MRIEVPDLSEIEDLIFKTAIERFGDPARSNKRIAMAIRDLSSFYISEPEVRGRYPDSLTHQIARMTFFTLADLPKAFTAAAELDALLGIGEKPRLKILDIGVGYGAQSLGLLLYLLYQGSDRSIQLDVVDKDLDALEAFDQVLTDCERSGIFENMEHRILHVDLEKRFDFKEAYDLIMIGNVLCEVKATLHYSLVTKILSSLTESGFMFIIEPALKATSRNLHALRDELLKNEMCRVIAPCTRTGGCPCLTNANDWCHESRSYLLPPRCRQLSVATGLRRFDLKWSYLTLSRHRTLDERYTAAWRAVSSLQKYKGKSEIFLCGTPGRLRSVLFKKERGSGNHDFKRLDRGYFVWIQGAHETADHIMLDKESTVVFEAPGDLSGRKASGIGGNT